MNLVNILKDSKLLDNSAPSLFEPAQRKLWCYFSDSESLESEKSSVPAFWTSPLIALNGDKNSLVFPLNDSGREEDSSLMLGMTVVLRIVVARLFAAEPAKHACNPTL